MLIGLFYQAQNYVQTQRHTLSVTPKNWEFGEWSEPRKLSVFQRKIDLKLQKPEGFFPGGKYGELSIKKLD